MLKTLLYIFILALLGFGVWYFLFSDKSGRTYNSEDAGFGIRDTAAIGKIFIAANNNPSNILLERKPEGWVLNGKYPVLQSTLRQLLTTIHTQQAVYPVPDNQRNDVIKSLAGGGIKTEIYDLEGRKMRTFFVGGELNRFIGTTMLMDGSERPYVVQIPGFEGYLTTRYSTDLNMWRDRIVFDYAPEQIEQISIHYAQEPLNSFTLIQKDGKISVLLDTALHYNKPVNDRRARSYLSFFQKLYAEGYASGMMYLDTIVRHMPEKATIDVITSGGKHQQVKVIYFPKDGRSKNWDKDIRTFDDNFHSDVYFAILNNGADTATIQIPTFEKIFRRGYEFFVPDENPAIKSELPAGVGASTH